MKKLSITTKITLWYAIFLMVIAVCFFAVIIWVGAGQTAQTSKLEVQEEVTEAQRKIVSKDGMIQFRHGFKSYDDGVYIAMFYEDGDIIEGKNPVAGFEQPEFIEGQVTTFKDDSGTTWYLYDMTTKVDKTKVWLRGYREDVALSSAYSKMISLGLIFLPLLLTLAIIGGLFITKRSFLPVRKIVDCVNSVERDGDFSRRIDVSTQIEETNDEIVELSSNFNSMFDKIEKLFAKEKQFTADVSHELRTPLSLIMAQSQYALEDEEYRQEALGKINDEARRMADLVSKLLLLSRSDKGTVNLQFEKLNLSGLCEMVAEQQSILLDESQNIEIKTQIQDHIFVQGDEATIIRVILNLTQNAVKYGQNTRGEKAIIKISLTTEGDVAICSVSDNGDGIPPEELPLIWDKFYRIEKSRSKEGTGLGLSLAKALVEANHGQIYAKSQLGQGSSFIIKFKLLESEE